ncbi:hypothetical protein LUZ61_019478 [Rhynchospora tenuis]|uniref:Cytochrome P450 n=1 Tax=Rhynchospora tenuis TaxID=198213 RepID=A0AAD5ZBH7_9POAL|nr:hypothetical protein LUZ61_019478 [Rhynchospora tenuis]
MEISWLLVLLLLCVSFLIIKSKAQDQCLPPGPPAVPFFGNLLSLRQNLSNLESLLHDLHEHYGPIVSLRLGSRLLIFISDRQLAHSALITYGATFASRPTQSAIREILTVNYHTISSAKYGPLWRLLRRNLAGELPDEGGRSLIDDELIALCSEFLIAGTDTTSTALQWIMADLVKNQGVQLRLWDEIKSVLSKSDSEDIEEGMLAKMPYLKAVVLEALRRHPPVHHLLHHAVTEDFTLGKYVIPKEAWVSINVANIGMDKEVWDNPTEFKPERFLEGGEGINVDITGTKEIKMMPFGAGRRICAGLGIAMLHLEYFVANLVKEFEWKGIEGEEVDFAEKAEFTVVMKNPLRAHLVPRK